MNGNNLIKNGDFANGEKAPWLTSGKEVGIFKETDQYYVRIPVTNGISQNLQVPTGPSTLKFEARTREKLEVGQSILFGAMIYFGFNDGSFHFDPHMDFVKSSEWQAFSFDVLYVKADGASLMISPWGITKGAGVATLQDLPVGTLEFRDFTLLLEA